MWDPRKRSCAATLYGHKHTVMKVLWNPVDPNWLLTASRDHTLKLYDIRVLRNAETFKGHDREVTACAWHPFNARLFASGGYDGRVSHWLVGRDEPLHTHMAHEQAVWDLAFHPVGHVLATASNDHRVRFWCRVRRRAGRTLVAASPRPGRPSAERPSAGRPRRRRGGVAATPPRNSRGL